MYYPIVSAKLKILFNKTKALASFCNNVYKFYPKDTQKYIIATQQPELQIERNN